MPTHNRARALCFSPCRVCPCASLYVGSTMIYLTETNVDTTSTSHFRTFLKPGSKYSTAVNKEANKDRGASMASRAFA